MEAGSVADVYVIGAELVKIPADCLSSTLRVICSHLNLEKPEDFEEPDKSDGMSSAEASRIRKTRMLAFFSMQVVRSLRHAIHLDSSLRSILAPKALQILKSVQLFYDYFFVKEKGKRSYFGREAMVITLAGTLVVLAGGVDFETKVLPDGEAFELCVRLWLEELEEARTTRDTARRYLMASDLLLRCLQAAHDQDKLADAHARLLKIAGMPAADVAALSLRNLRTLFKVQTNDLHDVRICTSIVYLLMFQGEGKESIMRTDIVEKDGVQILTKLAVLMTSSAHLGPAPLNVLVTDTVDSCFKSLFLALHSKHSVMSALRMIQFGVLEAMVNCSGMLKDLPLTLRETIKLFAKTLLPKFLVYRSVLTHAIKSLKKLTIENKLDEVTSSDLKDEWTFFTNVVFERASYLAGYNFDLAKVAGQGTCTNVRFFELSYDL